MIQRCQDLDFPLEARREALTAHKIRKQHLHGLDAIGNETPYAVHISHPATTELLDDLVIADALFGLHTQLPQTERSDVTCPEMVRQEPGRCRPERRADPRS